MTQAHTFQIAAVLIEAAEEEGAPKTTLMNKIRVFLKRTIDWIKSKLKGFKDFLTKKIKIFDVFFKGFDKILKEVGKVVSTRTYKDKRVKIINTGNVKKFYKDLTKNYAVVYGASKIAGEEILKLSERDKDMLLNRLRGSIEDLKTQVDTYNANIDKFTPQFRAEVEVYVKDAVNEARDCLSKAKEALQAGSKTTGDSIKRIESLTTNLEGLEKDIESTSGRWRNGASILVRETMVFVGNTIRAGIVFIKAILGTIKAVASPIVNFFKGLKKGEEETTGGDLLPALVY